MLFRDTASLDESAEAAAALLGTVDAETLVKDYWVTECLRILSRDFGTHFVFKGGTSLTKAVRCVDRFSEDIDILVTSKPTGQSYTGLMKAMVRTIARATSLTDTLVRSTTNIARDVSFQYPTRHENLYKPEIVLEMGIRGTDFPDHLIYEIRPMFADARLASFDADSFPDLTAFEVAVMHPARTLWEKVTLLHALVESGSWRNHRDPSRQVRHYGDIAALFGVATVRSVLSDAEVRRSLDSEVRQTSSRHFDEVPAVPSGGYANSGAFVPTDEYLEFLVETFDPAVETLWSPSSRPTLRGVLEVIAASANLLDPSQKTRCLTSHSHVVFESGPHLAHEIIRNERKRPAGQVVHPDRSGRRRRQGTVEGDRLAGCRPMACPLSAGGVDRLPLELRELPESNVDSGEPGRRGPGACSRLCRAGC